MAPEKASHQQRHSIISWPPPKQSQQVFKRAENQRRHCAPDKPVPTTRLKNKPRRTNQIPNVMPNQICDCINNIRLLSQWSLFFGSYLSVFGIFVMNMQLLTMNMTHTTTQPLSATRENRKIWLPRNILDYFQIECQVSSLSSPSIYPSPSRKN